MATVVTQTLASSASFTLGAAAATLASSATAGRESDVITNAGSIDALVYLSMTANGTPAASSFAYLFAYASEDGTNYSSPATGSNAAITLPGNLVLIGQLAWLASSNQNIKGVFSVAKGFGGILPRKWGIAVVQSSGVALSACSASYSLVTYTNT